MNSHNQFMHLSSSRSAIMTHFISHQLLSLETYPRTEPGLLQSCKASLDFSPFGKYPDFPPVCLYFTVLRLDVFPSLCAFYFMLESFPIKMTKVKYPPEHFMWHTTRRPHQHIMFWAAFQILEKWKLWHVFRLKECFCKNIWQGWYSTGCQGRAVQKGQLQGCYLPQVCV